MKKLFDNLKNLMNRYDLYQAFASVGDALNELETAVNSETRVYVIDTEDERMDDVYWEELTDEEFMFEAEEQGRVYTLDGFAKAFNFEEINSSTDAIRFIQVPVYV